MWWDTHFHLDSFAKKEIIPEMLERAVASQVPTCTAIGGSDEANDLVLRSLEAFPQHLYGTVGYDREVAPEWDQDFSSVEAIVDHPGVVAVGECGLDYFHKCGTREEQHTLFEANLTLSRSSGKPVIVHSREAEADTLSVLKTHSDAWSHADRPCAVLHCFTGDTDFALKLVDMNIFISFSGILTFKNAAQIQEAAKVLPENVLLVETDSPYLAPVPHRGERNEPAWVSHVGAFLAELRGTSVEEMAEITTRNAAHFFQQPPKAE